MSGAFNFQRVVNAQPAPGEPGDFASSNPRTSVDAGPGGFTADSDSIRVGYFAWGDPTTGLADNDLVANALLGFVHREQQALITAFLAPTSLLIPQGYPVTLMNQGDFWAYFPTGAAVGDTVYANNTTGAPQNTSSGATATNFKVVSTVDVPNSVTASIATTGVMTVSVFGTGPGLAPGQFLTGTGVADQTEILSQLSGTPGGAGTYQVSEHVLVTSTTIAAVGGQMGKISSWQAV